MAEKLTRRGPEFNLSPPFLDPLEAFV